jgi:hypothetical protein
MQWREYQAVVAFYGARKAKRSDVPLMEHIDQGLTVLEALGATERAMRAYCLHPLLQADEDLAQSYERGVATLTDDPSVLVLALEYRHIANATLSPRLISSADDIPLSPLDEVNDMLRADKVQNWKDFVRHHRGTHPRSAELERYFKLWHSALSLSQARVAALVELAEAGTTR